MTITFDRPLDPFSIGLGDFQLEQVGDAGAPIAVEAAAESPGPASDQVTLTPAEGLAPGHYRVLLGGGSQLSGADGSTLGGAGDLALGDFWVARGVSLGDAIPLGTPGPVPSSTAGALDFQANPEDTRLYQVTLPVGHFWQLGVEVDAATLAPTLALFDSTGKVLSTAVAGRGQAPSSPYLFAGLAPGTYYIGVSGPGNIPGTASGYDPASGTPGSTLPRQPGGTFTLQVVADTADSPAQLRSFTLDHGNSLDPAPTGFTLGFSQAMQFLAPIGNIADTLGQGVEVVGQDGLIWPVMASSLDVQDARISYLFRTPLPQGQYTVRLAQDGALVDLSGQAPVAPGKPAGVLAAFSVGADTQPWDPHDLGALLPGFALQGISVDTFLSPGQTYTYHVALTFPQKYAFETSYIGGPLAIQRTGPDGVVAIDPGPPGVLNGADQAVLAPGDYLISLSATGTQPVEVHLTIEVPSFKPESLLPNGIGQGPGLSLRLISIPAPIPSSSSSSSSIPPAISPPLASAGQPGGAQDPTSRIAQVPSKDSTPATSLPAPSPGPKGGDIASSPASPVLPGSLSGLVADLVGRPSPSALPASPPGPSASIPQASSISDRLGVPQGNDGPGTKGRLAFLDLAPAGARALLVAAIDDAGIADSETRVRVRDEAATSPAGAGLESLLFALAGWFRSRIPSLPGEAEGPALLHPEALDADSQRPEQAFLANPAFVLAVGVAAALVILSRSQARDWIRRSTLRPRPARPGQVALAIRRGGSPGSAAAGGRTHRPPRKRRPMPRRKPRAAYGVSGVPAGREPLSTIGNGEGVRTAESLVAV